MKPTSLGRADRGMTLIEVLVAILVFSFGLLGLIGLQAKAVQYSVSAEDTNRAALLASDLAATMRLAGAAAWTWKDTTDEVKNWKLKVADPAQGGLPGGKGVLEMSKTATGGNVATITLTWRPPSSTSGVDNKYFTQVVQ